MVRKIIILGGGSAGSMAALALRRRLPQVQVLMIRSSEIGVIGVGEGSTPGVTEFLHNFLGLPVQSLMEMAEPAWKLGTHFLWGPRPRFFFPFGAYFDHRFGELPRNNAFYCSREMEDFSPFAAMMARNRVFMIGPDGRPQMQLQDLAYHFENEKLVKFLERAAIASGTQVMEDKVARVEQDDRGIARLHLASGRVESADLYVDCSGFVSLLLGKTLQEPFVSYKSTLFCDRALVGGWAREDEPILPYTTAQTMNAGWSWQIEHRNRINRGYVYSSDFISDAEAELEFRAVNPKVGPTRIVPFVSGRYERSWVKNVVAIGNASGFVEPLEATALVIIATRCQVLVETLMDAHLDPPPVHRDLFNRHTAEVWDSIRRFIAIHYRFNTRLDTPFWRHCREKTDLAGSEDLVEYYKHSGPSVYWAKALVSRYEVFGINAYLVMLVGQKVPSRVAYEPTEKELMLWQDHLERNRHMACSALTSEQAWNMFSRPSIPAATAASAGAMDHDMAGSFRVGAG